VALHFNRKFENHLFQQEPCGLVDKALDWQTLLSAAVRVREWQAARTCIENFLLNFLTSELIRKLKNRLSRQEPCGLVDKAVVWQIYMKSSSSRPASSMGLEYKKFSTQLPWPRNLSERFTIVSTRTSWPSG